jgi:hypothetical protein
MALTKSAFSIVRKYEEQLKTRHLHAKLIEERLVREIKINKECRIIIARKDQEISTLKKEKLCDFCGREMHCLCPICEDDT